MALDQLHREITLITITIWHRPPHYKNVVNRRQNVEAERGLSIFVNLMARY